MWSQSESASASRTNPGFAKSEAASSFVSPIHVQSVPRNPKAPSPINTQSPPRSPKTLPKPPSPKVVRRRENPYESGSEGAITAIPVPQSPKKFTEITIPTLHMKMAQDAKFEPLEPQGNFDWVQWKRK
jgi:hypothetical protein